METLITIVATIFIAGFILKVIGSLAKVAAKRHLRNNIEKKWEVAKFLRK